MKILLVAATSPESALIREKLGMETQDGELWETNFEGKEIRLVNTGIGMVSTAYCLGNIFANHTPDLAINLGIAGSFDPDLAIGQVVEIVEDTFSEMGAEDHESLLSIEDLGFPQFERGENRYFQEFRNPSPSALSIPKVSAITVNRVHGNVASIRGIKNRLGKQVETMEGAAFFHAVLRAGVKAYAFRGISNYVEPRDRSRWQIGKAIKNVQEYILDQVL